MRAVAIVDGTAVPSRVRFLLKDRGFRPGATVRVLLQGDMPSVQVQGSN